MIEFHLDGRSGLSPYQQLVRQVRQALRLGILTEGEQLPTVKEVVGRLAINPNTVLKAYRELEHEGLVSARPGVGTFVTATLADSSLAAHGPLRADLTRWLAKARRCGPGRREHRGAVPQHLSGDHSGGDSVTALISAQGLGKSYGKRPALVDCDLDIPAGHIVGLVGPNGAGKTTLLNLVTGMLAPTTGAITVLGSEPGRSPAQLARVGYVAQDTPTYAQLSVADHLRLRRPPQPGLGRRSRRGAHRGARPGPEAEGRPAVRRPARPAGADARARQAAGAARAGRAGRRAGPAREARVPPGPHGGRRPSRS